MVTFPSIQMENARYESTLCNTKVRYQRAFNGSPKEAEDEFQEKEEKGEKEVILTFTPVALVQKEAS